MRVTRLFSLSLASLLAPLLVVLSALAAPEPPLRLVSDIWPPFTDVETKPRQAIDLVKEALKRGGINPTFAIASWNVALLSLERSHYDGSAAMWKSTEREKTMLFSKPYLENRLVLVARKGDDVSAPSVAKLAGKRLALTRGYAYGDAVDKAQGLVIVYRDNDADCLRALLKSEADYVLLDELMLYDLTQHDAAKVERLLAIGKVPLVENPLHFALRKSYPRAQEIIAKFNKTIDAMIADGSYNRVLALPWIRADVDGDGDLEYVTSSRAPQKIADPQATHSGYSVFTPPTNAPNTGRSPEYVVDGKSYNNWGDAANTLQRAGPSANDGPYRYSTGFVLGEF
jgi:polar amino acid transport system substrate-binding protein